MKMLGLKDLQRNIDQTNRELMEAEDPAQMEAAEPILEAWQARVPILDGNYRRALGISWLGKKGAAIGARWMGDIAREDQPIFYMKRLEFGDSAMPAQPSARPALDASKDKALAAAEEPFRTVIRGTRRRKRKVPTV